MSISTGGMPLSLPPLTCPSPLRSPCSFPIAMPADKPLQLISARDLGLVAAAALTQPEVGAGLSRQGCGASRSPACTLVLVTTAPQPPLPLSLICSFPHRHPRSSNPIPVLLVPQEWANTSVEVAADELTPAQMCQEFARVQVCTLVGYLPGPWVCECVGSQRTRADSLTGGHDCVSV